MGKLCSFEGTALYRLFVEAAELEPDYSERKAELPTDVRFHKAPDIVGKCLAMKKQLLAQKRAKGRDITPNELRHYEYAMSVLANAAEFEFREFIRHQPKRERMQLRKTGWIMIEPE